MPKLSLFRAVSVFGSRLAPKIVKKVAPEAVKVSARVKIAYEFYQAGVDLADPSVSPFLKITSVAKTGCCTVSMVSDFLSKASPDPVLRRMFSYCCHGSNLVYEFLKNVNETTV